MAYNLILKSVAEQDISKAVEWYAKQAPHLPEEFITAIDYSLNSIKENPKHFQKRYGEVRIVFTERFPYGIYYTIEDDTVFVHAILHTKRNPNIGLERI